MVLEQKIWTFGIFRRGGFSSKIKFYDHFVEEINIRLDNGQNKILVLLIFIYKYIKNFQNYENSNYGSCWFIGYNLANLLLKKIIKFLELIILIIIILQNSKKKDIIIE